MTDCLLQGENLSCERDRRILFAGLNLQVAAGDLLQVEGANGSGKTTLLRVLTGLSDSYEGQVRWMGQALHRVRQRFNAQTHYLSHNAGIKAALTAEENLRWYRALSGPETLSAARTIEECLGQVGLRGYEDVPCYTLSAGQQRRVSLARLLLIPARLWVLDEPFTAIDKKGVLLVENMIREQVAGGGAVVVTTHQDLQSIAKINRISLG